MHVVFEMEQHLMDSGLKLDEAVELEGCVLTHEVMGYLNTVCFEDDDMGNKILRIADALVKYREDLAKEPDEEESEEAKAEEVEADKDGDVPLS